MGDGQVRRLRHLARARTRLLLVATDVHGTPPRETAPGLNQAHRSSLGRLPGFPRIPSSPTPRRSSLPADCRITVSLIPDPDEGGFAIKVNELPGCLSQGDTAEEALVRIREAMAGWLEVALEEGLP
ncbi:MAG: type II toxin-antitoxin system HicB family antitoxin, partial [Planctomycetota bacterium]